MKVVIWLRIERVQRIIAIQGVSLVRILNLPSLDRSVGEILNIPSGIVGRENLSGESLVSCAPSRFSLEILPPSLLRSGIFTDTHSFAPEYYYISLPQYFLRCL